MWDLGSTRFCERCGERLPVAVVHGRAEHSCAPGVIRFYGVGSEYGAFSNFAPYQVLVEGIRYPTTEHYFQSQKFAGTAYAQTIRLARTPFTAARLGRSRRHKIRSDWESVKREVMLVGLRAKFNQHEEPRSLLLGTGEAGIVEHTANDAYWGDGGDGSGKNWLGRLLVRLRGELRG
jgi:N-glycosidase YbiA